jgi:hypothetical protein
MRRFAMVAQHSIGGLVRPVRHLFGGKVRETGEDLVDLGAQSRRVLGRLSRRCGGGLRPKLVKFNVDTGRRAFGRPDRPGDAIALCLRFLRAGLGIAPFPVKVEDPFGVSL